MHICDLLLHMLHAALSVRFCVGQKGHCVKTAEPIKMPFGGQTFVGTKNLNLMLGGGPDLHGNVHF